MKITSKAVVAFGMVSGLVAINATVANAKVLEHIVFHDDTTFLGFDSSSPLDCGGFTGALSSHASLNGFEFTNKSTSNGDVRSNSAVITFFQQNGCTGDFVFGFGDIPGGFTQDGLKSGHFLGTVVLTDFGGFPLGTVAMDITVVGTGPVSQNNQHIRSTITTPTGPIVQTIHSNGKSVDAVISAFAFSFNGAAVPAPDSSFAQIAVTKSGTMQTEKANK